MPCAVRRDGHVEREIDSDEAAVVRRIFQLCADGDGLVRIAKTLTAEGLRPPGRHTKGWAPSAIREMLHRTCTAARSSGTRYSAWTVTAPAASDCGRSPNG